MKKLLYLVFILYFGQIITAQRQPELFEAQSHGDNLLFNTRGLPSNATVSLQEILRALERQEIRFFQEVAPGLRYPERNKSEQRQRLQEERKQTIESIVSNCLEGKSHTIPHEIGIALFPLDNIPEDERKRKITELASEYVDKCYDYKTQLEILVPTVDEIDQDIQRAQQKLEQFEKLKDTHPRKRVLIAEIMEKIQLLQKKRERVGNPLTDDQIRQTREYEQHRATSELLLQRFIELYQEVQKSEVN